MSSSDNSDGIKPLYEKEIQFFLAENLHLLGHPKLTLIQIEYPVSFGREQGRIDILAKDPNGNISVIEVKRGVASRGAIGQLQSYMGAMLQEFPGKKVEGILVAGEVDDSAKSALLIAPVRLFQFTTRFEFKHIQHKGIVGSLSGLATGGETGEAYWEQRGGVLMGTARHCSSCGSYSNDVMFNGSRVCCACGSAR